MQSQMDLLSNQIDVSEIVSEQGFVSSNGVLNGEILIALENLAQNIGYNFSSSYNSEMHNEIECALDTSEIAPSNEEWIQIIYKASSKIRELRELIENLSK